MKGRLAIDPAQCEYGAATGAVRDVLSAWAGVDWFAPPAEEAGIGVQLFREHNALARARMPELFPEALDLRSVASGWKEFAELCARVRTSSSWDWKFAALKKLSFQHSKALGWSLTDEARGKRSVEHGGRPGPGDLFFRFGEHVVWMDLGPKLDLGEHAEIGGWYLGYAVMDLVEAIEWQLAENSDRLDGNPFLPLLRCYGAGFYPFSLGPTTVVLFSFN